jgi:hypothetical protein
VAISPDKEHLSMIGAWITLGLAMIASVARRWQRRPGRAVQRPGFVSHRWLAEYRNSHLSDPDW